ncbi:hypothetical protein NMY22_g16182 [Coprinellus aureogranulatus]|nr:hypothetical protein NMY22_g16182 [Coprinellus aureogranulatus]
MRGVDGSFGVLRSVDTIWGAYTAIRGRRRGFAAHTGGWIGAHMDGFEGVDAARRTGKSGLRAYNQRIGRQREEDGRTEDDDRHVDAAEHAELVRLLEQPILALRIANAGHSVQGFEVVVVVVRNERRR